MAIAYYVPREYGPPPPPQHQVPQNNPEIIDIHNHHFVHQDANNNNVQGARPRPSSDNQHSLVSLFSGFVNEMIGVFRSGSGVEEGSQQRGQQEPVRMRNRRPAARDLPDLRIDQGNGQDNNANLPDLLPPPLRSLPDIVTCHAGISFHYNSSSNNQPDTSRDGPPVSPLSPTSSNHQPSTSMDFEVSVKWGVGQQQETPVNIPAQQEEELTPEETFRLAGAQLRMIADSFQNERSHGSTRSRPTTQSTFELKIVITVAVPTVALVALGLAYLRRS